MLSGVDATLFLDQVKVMGNTVPEGLKKLIAAMERAQPIASSEISRYLDKMAVQAYRDRGFPAKSGFYEQVTLCQAVFCFLFLAL